MRHLIICAMYIVTFGSAAIQKFTSGGTPDWFIKQFSGTFLNVFPGALEIQFYSIALLEAVIALLFAASMLRRFSHLFGVGLLLVLILMVSLSLGLRVSGDFHGAAELFIYFGVTLYLLDQLSHRGSDLPGMRRQRFANAGTE